MTRINLIKPSHLTQRHLNAEYKEITQFLHLIGKRNAIGSNLKDIPKYYTLNKGHCLFFFNKGKYIHERFQSLRDEIVHRGGNLNQDLFEMRLNKILDTYPEKWYNDYKPDNRDYQVVIDRIKMRIDQKPHLYPDADRFFNNIKEYGVTYEASHKS